MSEDWKVQTENVEPLLDMVLGTCAFSQSRGGNPANAHHFPRFLFVYRADCYWSFTTWKTNRWDECCLVNRKGEVSKQRIKELNLFDGLGRVKVNEVNAGDICAVIGLEEFEIGDTIADAENPEALPLSPSTSPR